MSTGTQTLGRALSSHELDTPLLWGVLLTPLLPSEEVFHVVGGKEHGLTRQANHEGTPAPSMTTCAAFGRSPNSLDLSFLIYKTEHNV